MIQSNTLISVVFVPWNSALLKLHAHGATFFDIEDKCADNTFVKQELTNNYTTDMGGIFHIELEA